MRTAIVLGLSAVVGIGGVIPAMSHEVDDKLKGHLSGTVTTVHERGIRIGDKDYRLSATAPIKDQYDRPVDIKRLPEGHKMYFHLDSDGVIDSILVIIPS